MLFRDTSAAGNRGWQWRFPLHSSSLKGGPVQVLSQGQTIRHEQYGVGTITESNSERTTVDFDSHGLKKFVTSIWTAELLREAPADAGKRKPGRARRKSVKK